MKKVLLDLALIIASVIGIADATYLSYQKLNGYLPPCTAHFQCERVLISKWSQVGHVPLSLFGLGFYVVIFGLALALYFGYERFQYRGFKFPTNLLLVLVASWGAVFSWFLIFIMGVVLQSWCLYCLISAVNCQFILALAFLHWKVTR